MTTATTSTENELVITRVFDAPRELVYEAWTDAEQLTAWLGPEGFTAHSVSGDVRPGGRWRSAIRSADGTEFWCSGEYRETVPPERLVFTFEWEDTDGSKPGENSVITVSLADADGKTEMTFRQVGLESADSRDGHTDGWQQAFNKLAAHIAAK